MARLIERSLLLGLGALTLTRDKVNHFVDKLIEEGEVKPEEAPGIVDRLVTRSGRNCASWCARSSTACSPPPAMALRN